MRKRKGERFKFQIRREDRRRNWELELFDRKRKMTSGLARKNGTRKVT